MVSLIQIGEYLELNFNSTLSQENIAEYTSLRTKKITHQTTIGSNLILYDTKWRKFVKSYVHISLYHIIPTKASKYYRHDVD